MSCDRVRGPDLRLLLTRPEAGRPCSATLQERHCGFISLYLWVSMIGRHPSTYMGAQSSKRLSTHVCGQISSYQGENVCMGQIMGGHGFSLLEILGMRPCEWSRLEEHRLENKPCPSAPGSDKFNLAPDLTKQTFTAVGAGIQSWGTRSGDSIKVMRTPGYACNRIQLLADLTVCLFLEPR